MFLVNRRVRGDGLALVDVSTLEQTDDNLVAPSYVTLGEGKNFSDPVEAITAAERVLYAWNIARCGHRPARLAVTVGSMTCCFYDAQVSRALQWAQGVRGVA